MTTWRDLVPETLRARLRPTVRRLRTRAAGPLLQELDTDALLGLLFPTMSPAEVRKALVPEPPDRITRPIEVREILMQVEQRLFPTPFVVHFDEGDLVETEVDGMRFLVDPADRSVSATLARVHSYEPHLTAVFRRYVEPGMTVIDAGANIGYYSVLASTLVGPTGRVLSVEPSSENCRLVAMNAGRNGAGNVELLPVALSDHMGWSYFSASIGSNGALSAEDVDTLRLGHGVVVPTFRLDDLVQGPVHFVKLDIEGGEGLALRGARRIVETYRPVITTELSREMLRRVSGMEPEDLLFPLEELGYRIVVLGKEGGPDAVVGAKELLQAWDDVIRIEDLLLVPSD